MWVRSTKDAALTAHPFEIPEGWLRESDSVQG